MVVSRSPSLGPQAAAVGNGRAVGTVGIARAERIGDGARRKRRAVAVYLVDLVHLVCLVCFVISFIGPNGPDRPEKPNRSNKPEKPDRQARSRGAAGSEGIGRRVRIKRIGAQIAEIVGGGGERTQQEQEEKHRHRAPLRNDRLGSRLLPAREHGKRSMMSAPGNGSWHRFRFP